MLSWVRSRHQIPGSGLYLTFSAYSAYPFKPLMSERSGLGWSRGVHFHMKWGQTSGWSPWDYSGTVHFK